MREEREKSVKEYVGGDRHVDGSDENNNGVWSVA